MQVPVCQFFLHFERGSGAIRMHLENYSCINFVLCFYVYIVLQLQAVQHPDHVSIVVTAEVLSGCIDLFSNISCGVQTHPLALR